MTTSNYDNRKVDLLIFQGNTNTPGSGLQDANLSLFSDELGNGKIATGVVKMAQKVGVLLLTHTHFYDRLWGSELAAFVFGPGSASKIKTSLGDHFPALVTQARDLLISQEVADDPDDERVRDLSLEGLDLDFNAGSIIMTIRITVLSGEDTVLVVPINKPLLT